MPADFCYPERWLTSEADPDDRPACGKIGPTSREIGAVHADGPALLDDLEGVRLLLVVVGFSRERVPLPIIEHHDALLKVDVSHLADVQAQSLFEPTPDSQWLGRLDGLPFAC
jgi:hypothetical protein